ncbi:Protein IQ-DOMAIN 31, partial [Zea mays]
MGKSPAKWIKSVLFGKKSSSRSGSTKAKDLSKGASNKGAAAAGKEPVFSESSPVISEPVLVSAHNNETVREVAKGENSSVQEVPVTDVSQDLEKQGSVGSDTSNDAERVKEERAAVKAQAAFRGYLARRAFRALKGIIRLQALIRGHLVRRQAVSTLRATWLIVKFQALVRGRNLRLSEASIQATMELSQQNLAGAKPGSWKEKLSSNAFARKLLSSSIVVEALHFQYDEMDPNSAFNWLERWTISHVWKPASQPRRVSADAKPHTRKASYAMETESVKLKRNARRSSAGPFEPSQTNTAIEIEKTRRNPRKLSSTPAESVPDGQLTELEKVKRSLRKVTNSVAETSKASSPKTEIPNHQEVQCERPLRRAKQVPIHLENQEPDNVNLSDNAKMDILVPDIQPDVEVASDPVTITNEENVDEPPSVVAPVAEIMPLQDINNDENALVNDVEERSKEEHPSTESLKGSKRRSSFSAKPEYPENG